MNVLLLILMLATVQPNHVATIYEDGAYTVESGGYHTHQLENNVYTWSSYENGVNTTYEWEDGMPFPETISIHTVFCEGCIY